MRSEGTTPSFAGFKARFRRSVARTLYHTGLLRGMERLARTHELWPVQGSRLPRLRRNRTSKFGILCYHRVGSEGIPLFSRLDPGVFEAQMRYVRRHYRVVSLGQLCQELREAGSVEPTLAVTFDDGYRDLYTFAFPTLQKYRIPATIYLIGRCLEEGEAPWYDRIFVALRVASSTWLEVDMDRPRRFHLSSPAARARAAWEIVCYLRTVPDGHRREWCAAFERQFRPPQEELRDRMLNWEQVRSMQRAGVFFGAHTMTHPVVSQLPSAALEEECGRSKELLEHGLGTAVEDFAYPFGKATDRSSEAEEFLARRGFRSAVTTIEGVNCPNANPFMLRRLQIGDDPSLSSFAFNVSHLFLKAASDLQVASCMPSDQVDSHRGVS